jgi:hypothetical protein
MYWKKLDAQFTAGVSGKRKRLPSSKVVDQQSNEEDVNVMPLLPQAEKPPSKQKKKKPAKNTPVPPSDKCQNVFALRYFSDILSLEEGELGIDSLC